MVKGIEREDEYNQERTGGDKRDKSLIEGGVWELKRYFRTKRAKNTGKG